MLPVGFFDTIRRLLELRTGAGTIELSDKILQRAFSSTSCINRRACYEDESQVQACLQPAQFRMDHGGRYQVNATQMKAIKCVSASLLSKNLSQAIANHQPHAAIRSVRRVRSRSDNSGFLSLKSRYCHHHGHRTGPPTSPTQEGEFDEVEMPVSTFASSEPR